MKKIGALTNVARDDEFHITERANKLMNDVSVKTPQSAIS